MSIKINATHPAYDKRRSQWQRCRDAVEGSDAVKARGSEYLPLLSKQTSGAYHAYKTRALWYGASARTVQGLIGAIMRKEPSVEVPKELDDHLKDVTLTGISFAAFTKTVLTEILTTGRYGVLVDMPAESHDTQRPYYAAYTAESIVNWRTAMRNGVPQLVLLVLCESLSEPKSDDQYQNESIEQCRVLRITEAGEYEVELFRKDAAGDWISQQIIKPTYRGEPFTFIPFCFFGPNTITPDIEKPPILDLVDVNLSHYRSSADLEHGRHFCGLPTPWVAGFPENTTLQIGSSIAWVSSSPDAHAGMLEFTGQGLGALEKALESKERLMAVLGARLLEEPKKSVEAADTLTIRHSGEQSILRGIAGSVSTGLSKLLEWAALWSGLGADEAKNATVKLNTDFADASMTFAELESLIRSWQTGAISYETLYYNMERGEVTRPGIDAETEKAQAEQEAPPDLGNVLNFGSRN